jgi:chromosome partitioning protein
MKTAGKPLALVKKFDVKIVIVLNKHERSIKYPGATIKIPFSATLDYYNRRDQLYTKPVTKLAEYLLQELKRVTRSRWFE